jgi:hypothetical protein
MLFRSLNMNRAPYRSRLKKRLSLFLNKGAGGEVETDPPCINEHSQSSRREGYQTNRAWDRTNLLDRESANKSGDDGESRIVVGRNTLADSENLHNFMRFSTYALRCMKVYLAARGLGLPIGLLGASGGRDRGIHLDLGHLKES